MKQVQLQIQAEAVISGFCWAYANALLQKLKELKEQKRIPMDYRDNKMVQQIVYELSQQVGADAPGVDEIFINAIINYTEEYLAIFHKK